MRKLLTALAILATGCGREFDFETSHGVRVYLNGHVVSAQQIEEQESYLLNALPADYSRTRTRECMQMASVEVFTQEEMCATNPDTCPAGLQVVSMLKVADYGCVAESSWIHEEAHWLLECVLQRYDDYHTEEPALWELINSRPKNCNE